MAKIYSRAGIKLGHKHAKNKPNLFVYACSRLVWFDCGNLLISKALEVNISAEGRTRTGTLDNQRGILSPLC